VGLFLDANSVFELKAEHTVVGAEVGVNEMLGALVGLLVGIELLGCELDGADEGQ